MTEPEKPEFNCPECNSENTVCYKIRYGTVYLKCPDCGHKFNKSVKRRLITDQGVLEGVD